MFDTRIEDASGRVWDEDSQGELYPVWISAESEGDDLPDDLFFSVLADGNVMLTANNHYGEHASDQTSIELRQAEARDLAIAILKSTGGKPADSEWAVDHSAPDMDDSYGEV